MKKNNFRISPALCALGLSAALAGCGGMKYTVDDGRKVDEKLLADIRLLGKGAQTLHPAIAKSAELQDRDCDTQWELPFDVATCYDLKENDCVAWVRGLNVDERLTVISTVPGSGLAPGDRIDELGGYARDNSLKMLKELQDLRESGRPFNLKTADGKTVAISPFKVCRGHVTLAEPAKAFTQDYHWLHSTHPLELFKKPLTRDEATWIVLWTQGLSEEGGARMKTYHYGLKTVKTVANLAAVASGVGAAARAAQSATASAAAAAGQAVAQQVGRSVASDVAEASYKFTQRQLLDAAQTAAMNRAGLGGISWVAGTVFDQADKWAFERMAKLGADPIAAFSLHIKLVEAGAVHNAFVFDDERMTQMKTLAAKAGMEEWVASLLRGETPHMMVVEEDSVITTRALSSAVAIEERALEAIPEANEAPGASPEDSKAEPEPVAALPTPGS